MTCRAGFVPFLLLILILALPGRLAAADPASADKTRAAEALVDLLVKEDFAGAYGMFDAKMKEALSEAKLGETWRAVMAQTGKIRSRAGGPTQKVEVFDVVIVACKFEKGPLDVKVVFDSESKIAGLFFLPAEEKSAASKSTPPPYSKKGSFHDKDVTVGSGEWALPGTLSMPVGSGPFAGLVLVQGSGPHDRDETIGPNKPFRDLAEGLASRGIAVLRYEKRTKQYGAKMAGETNLTVKEETIDDALGAAKLLETTSGVDPKRVFVLGHSLGGMLIPRIGRLDPEIGGLIVLAGTARPLDEVILEQVAYIRSLTGTSETDKKELAGMEAEVAKLKALDPATAKPGDSVMGVPVSYWLDLRGYQPAETAKELKQPLLILQGERDYQVTMADFQKWKEALGDRPNVVLKSYPDLNHLFISGQGKGNPAEYKRPGHVAAEVVEEIATWIKKSASQ